MSSDKKPPFRDAADVIADQSDADVLFINAGIFRPLDRKVLDLCSKRRRRKNVVLLLVTQGGDPDAAYRIARCLQTSYERYVLFVTGHCKSAGTLIAIGAHELVVADSGELGPLDVQMSKPDELLQRQSGLTATAALSTLHEQAFQAFEHFFLSLVTRSGNAISTRTATHLAIQLTSGLFAPVYQHVDPMHVGEAGRALQVAEQYGRLLNASAGNLRTEALNQLTSGYASHEFVIDRSQIESLFKNVRPPDTNEQALLNVLGAPAQEPLGQGERLFMAYLSTERPEPREQVLPGFGTGDSHEQDHSNARAETTADPVEGGASPAGQPEPPATDHLSTVGSHRATRGGRHSRPS